MSELSDTQAATLNQVMVKQADGSWAPAAQSGGGGGGTGDVVGPVSAVNNRVAFFDGITGKLIKDSGLTISGSNTGDQTSIVGITGTLAQFNTAVTDAELARTDAVNTFTGVQTFSTPIATGSVATMSATVGGGVPTPPNNTTTFLRGDGTFAAPPGGGGSGITRSVSNIAINTTAGATAVTDYEYNCTAALTLTLPTAVGNSNRYTVTRIAGLTTVATTSAQTINGSATATLTINNMSLDFVSDGANWNVK